MSSIFASASSFRSAALMVGFLTFVSIAGRLTQAQQPSDGAPAAALRTVAQTPPQPLPSFPLSPPQAATPHARPSPTQMPETEPARLPLGTTEANNLRSLGVVRAAHMQAPDAPTASPGEDALTPEKIASEIAAIDAVTGLDAEAKKELVERLNKASKWLQDEADWARRKSELDTQLASIPEQLRVVYEELAKPSPPTQIDFPTNPTVPQLETKLAELRHQVEIDEAASKTKDDEVENRIKRISEITKEVAEIDKKIADAKLQLNTLTEVDLGS